MQIVKISLFLLFYLSLVLSMSGQTTDTTRPDATETTTDQIQSQKRKGYFKIAWKQPYPNPYKAAIFSMVIPGVGQLYNRRYWKAPIVWGGFAALVYSVDYNKGWRDRFKTAYGLSLIGQEHEFSGIIRDSETLRRYRNKYDKQLQTTYVGFAGLYILNALDAYVDGHLKSFDMNDDLTLSIRPNLNASSGFGLGLFLSPSD